jgi:Uma2 family endonuclease
MATVTARRPATLEEALARPDAARVELIRGSLVEKAAPTAEHSRTQVGLDRRLGERFDRRPEGKWPGGWLLLTEVDVRLGAERFRPDLAGWRRERSPAPPAGRPVELRPDWICEIRSPSNEDVDRVDQLQSSFNAGVLHCWLADPLERVLEVYGRTDLAYALVLSARSGQRSRAEPLDAVELRVDERFGADLEDDEA